MPVTRTEVVAKLRRPPAIVENVPLPRNHVRFRLSPDFAISLGASIKAPGETLAAEPVELDVAHARAGDLEPYEELSAMRCGATPSDSREDYVEEAWRIVDPAIQASTPIHEYEPGTWGPKEAERMVLGAGTSPPPEGRSRQSSDSAHREGHT